MPQVIQCPSCHSHLSLPDQYLGQTVSCPQCQAAFIATPAVPDSAVQRERRYYDNDDRRERSSGDWRTARAAVSGPATGLFVTSLLGLLAAFGFIGLGVFFIIMVFVTPPRHDEWGIVFGCLASSFGPGLTGLIWSTLVMVGSRKMQSMSSLGWSLTAAYLSLVPCYCIIPALPIGIWALTALHRPEVRDAFRQD
jgi:hypothetical protein